MTAIQINAEILRNMSIIAEDERLMNRVAKYLRKLVAEKQDPTLFTKEDFFARIDKAKEGPSYELKDGDCDAEYREKYPVSLIMNKAGMRAYLPIFFIFKSFP